MLVELEVKKVEEIFKASMTSRISDKENVQVILEVYRQGFGILIIAKALRRIYNVSELEAKKIVLDITKETRFDQLDGRS